MRLPDGGRWATDSRGRSVTSIRCSDSRTRNPSASNSSRLSCRRSSGSRNRCAAGAVCSAAGAGRVGDDSSTPSGISRTSACGAMTAEADVFAGLGTVSAGGAASTAPDRRVRCSTAQPPLAIHLPNAANPEVMAVVAGRFRQGACLLRQRLVFGLFGKAQCDDPNQKDERHPHAGGPPVIRRRVSSFDGKDASG
jgi:hypothetical protein